MTSVSASVTSVSASVTSVSVSVTSASLVSASVTSASLVSASAPGEPSPVCSAPGTVRWSRTRASVGPWAPGREASGQCRTPSVSRTRCSRAASVRHLRSTISSGYSCQPTGAQSGPDSAGPPWKRRAARSEAASSTVPGSSSRSQAGRSPSREVNPSASRSRRDSSVSAATTPASSRDGQRPIRQAGSATRVSSRSQPAYASPTCSWATIRSP